MRNFIIKYFPFLGRYKRFFKAWADNMAGEKVSYAQHGEDAYIWDKVKDLSRTDYIYVDVGANHPSDISNTYLFYRKGFSGICIEPNKELVRLHQKFRKRDKTLAIGCADRTAVLEFYVSRTPVVSSFEKDFRTEYYKSEFLPVMRLEDFLPALDNRKIFLLSIDVEGMNYQVITGATGVLDRCLYICVEFENEKEKTLIRSLMEPRFIPEKEIVCNIIYHNPAFK